MSTTSSPPPLPPSSPPPTLPQSLFSKPSPLSSSSPSLQAEPSPSKPSEPKPAPPMPQEQPPSLPLPKQPYPPKSSPPLPNATQLSLRDRKPPVPTLGLPALDHSNATKSQLLPFDDQPSTPSAIRSVLSDEQPTGSFESEASPTPTPTPPAAFLPQPPPPTFLPEPHHPRAPREESWPPYTAGTGTWPPPVPVTASRPPHIPVITTSDYLKSSRKAPGPRDNTKRTSKKVAPAANVYARSSQKKAPTPPPVVTSPQETISPNSTIGNCTTPGTCLYEAIDHVTTGYGDDGSFAFGEDGRPMRISDGFRLPKGVEIPTTHTFETTSSGSTATSSSNELKQKPSAVAVAAAAVAAQTFSPSAMTRGTSSRVHVTAGYYNDDNKTFTFGESGSPIRTVGSAPRTKRSTKRNGTQIQHLNEVPRSLFYWNLVVATYQFVQCGALVYLASEEDMSWNVFVNFPGGVFAKFADEGNFGYPLPKQVFAVNLTWYAVVILALSGIHHFCTTLPPCQPTYYYYLKRNQSPFRWIEYAFSASLMRVMLAQLVGVTDLHTLFSIFALASTTMLLGWCHESINAKCRADGVGELNWSCFRAAAVPHFASWSIIFSYMVTSIFNEDQEAVTIFAWGLVFLLFVADCFFAALFYAQWAKLSHWRDYVHGEIGFIILSFMTKSILAWVNWAAWQ